MLILTTGVVISALSSTVAAAGKELMSNEIDLANPFMAKRYAIVSLGLTIVVQCLVSMMVYSSSSTRITALTSSDLEDVRVEYNTLVYVFLVMMFLETLNAHCAAMLLSLGLYKREMIIRTIILVVIQLPIACFFISVTDLGIKGLFYAQMSGTVINLLIHIVKLLIVKWEEYSFSVFARDEICILG